MSAYNFDFSSAFNDGCIDVAVITYVINGVITTTIYNMRKLPLDVLERMPHEQDWIQICYGSSHQKLDASVRNARRGEISAAKLDHNPIIELPPHYRVKTIRNYLGPLIAHKPV